MTEYGRGSGPEPWHPEDPLYGDQGWNGHQDPQVQVPYGSAPQQYPQQQQVPQSQQFHQETYPQQSHAQQAHAQPQQQQYPQHYQEYPPAYPQQQVQPQPQYDGQSYQYGTQTQQQQYETGQVGGWDTGQGQAIPFGGAPADPYGPQQPGYPGDTPDLYGTAEAFPPPQPPGQRTESGPPQSQGPVDAGTEGEAEAEREDHPFFAGGEDDAEDEADGSRRSRGGRERRGGKGKGRNKGKERRRNGAACLIVSLVLVGGVTGVGYYGYSFLQEKFGAPEDFVGDGTGAVEVEIPKGTTLGSMGLILKQAGVVKSADAFVAAAQEHPKGKAIQPGLYPMRKQMSAASAVELMTNPANLNTLIIREGQRNIQVYESIDKKLGLEEGTTSEVAKKQFKTLGLPAWANDNPKIKDPLEGFLFPSRYELGKTSTPERILKQMVARANEKYGELGIESKAKSLGLKTPLQLVTVASLVQAEGMNHDDFRKMSDVIYNRLKPTNDVTNRKLEFDSAINYLKNESNIDISRTEAKTLDDPYNTYFHEGLTPGPIGNPGSDALNAALSPDQGGWMFFVSVDGKTTTFTKTFAEHQELVAEFNRRRNGG